MYSSPSYLGIDDHPKQHPINCSRIVFSFVYSFGSTLPSPIVTSLLHKFPSLLNAVSSCYLSFPSLCFSIFFFFALTYNS
ncbi:uncharacterized protein EV420DRAFT_1542118 [Desarmillaria tabescens]|uniref:Uncharacterized protein n=1 Tax=Armillaria tabescens TaxID=1929756 RepID=A0AA39KGK3_ARMTA|nr:uncharacterized protein EV420DRAFT_1542118 [Desarmillaria tabescens]KAK0458413.1 hypothetical protein EV420DRAFT_1542118 [Desarmillaria tabescens]